MIPVHCGDRGHACPEPMLQETPLHTALAPSHAHQLGWEISAESSFFLSVLCFAQIDAWVYCLPAPPRPHYQV